MNPTFTQKQIRSMTRRLKIRRGLLMAVTTPFYVVILVLLLLSYALPPAARNRFHDYIDGEVRVVESWSIQKLLAYSKRLHAEYAAANQIKD